MSIAGWLNYNDLGTVKMKADFNFGKKYQKKKKKRLLSSPLQKRAKKWTLIVEVYSGGRKKLITFNKG